ncbi:MAG: ribose 5-phosphate isomerase B [Cyclobacteriaceae bacterium]|nr:ribose 5-phosphate isomerase B [Cyclobacteriaceae bacterium]
MMKIAIGSDHAGFSYKEQLKGWLDTHGYEVKDFGTFSDASADYPDHAHPVANEVESGKAALGVLVCGSGNGMAMAANKHQGIRAALCWNVELAELARSHNNANILSLPARFIPIDLALEILQKFLETNFEGGRHARRVDKIGC